MIDTEVKHLYNRYSIWIALLLLLLAFAILSAESKPIIEPISPLHIDILSQTEFSGIAGDYITVKAQITNNGKDSTTDITTFMALVDTENKMPVDLEDWSAEKGLFIGTIDAEQTLPLTWKIHFVKAGTYELFVAASLPGSPQPIVSTMTKFDVKPKKNLNPGKVLPVALGTPLILICIFMMINYRRLRTTQM